MPRTAKSIENMTLAELEALDNKLEQAKKKLKEAGKQFDKVVSAIKALGEYDKAALTDYLLSNNLIEIKKPAPDLVKMEFDPAYGKTRKRNFKVKLGEDPRKFDTATAMELWNLAKQNKAGFLAALTAEGKAHYGTAEGKAEIDSWFA